MKNSILRFITEALNDDYFSQIYGELEKSGKDRTQLKNELIATIKSLTDKTSVYNDNIIGDLAEFILNYWIATKLGKQNCLPNGDDFSVYVDSDIVTKQIKSIEEEYWLRQKHYILVYLYSLDNLLAEFGDRSKVKETRTDLFKLVKDIQQTDNGEFILQAIQDFFANDKHKKTIKYVDESNEAEEEIEKEKTNEKKKKKRAEALEKEKANQETGEFEPPAEENTSVARKARGEDIEHDIKNKLRSIKQMAPNAVYNVTATLNNEIDTYNVSGWEHDDYPAFQDLSAGELNEIGRAILRMVWVYATIKCAAEKIDGTLDPVLGENHERIETLFNEKEVDWKIPTYAMNKIVMRQVPHKMEVTDTQPTTQIGGDGGSKFVFNKRILEAIKIMVDDRTMHPEILSVDTSSMKPEEQKKEKLFPYIRAIPTRWRRNGYKTIDAIEQYEAWSKYLRSFPENSYYWKDASLRLANAMAEVKNMIMHIVEKNAAEKIQRDMTDEEKAAAKKKSDAEVLANNREQIEMLSKDGSLYKFTDTTKTTIKKADEIIDEQKKMFEAIQSSPTAFTDLVDIVYGYIDPRNWEPNGKLKDGMATKYENIVEPPFGTMLITPFYKKFYDGGSPRSFKAAVDGLYNPFKFKEDYSTVCKEMDDIKTDIVNNVESWKKKFHDRIVVMGVRNDLRKNLISMIDGYNQYVDAGNRNLNVSDLKWGVDTCWNSSDGGMKVGYDKKQLSDIRAILYSIRKKLADSLSAREYSEDESLGLFKLEKNIGQNYMDAIMKKPEVLNLDDEEKRKVRNSVEKEIERVVTLIKNIGRMIEKTKFDLSEERQVPEKTAKEKVSYTKSGTIAPKRQEQRTYRSPNFQLQSSTIAVPMSNGRTLLRDRDSDSRDRYEEENWDTEDRITDVTESCVKNLFGRIKNGDFDNLRERMVFFDLSLSNGELSSSRWKKVGECDTSEWCRDNMDEPTNDDFARLSELEKKFFNGRTISSDDTDIDVDIDYKNNKTTFLMLGKGTTNKAEEAEEFVHDRTSGLAPVDTPDGLGSTLLSRIDAFRNAWKKNPLSYAPFQKISNKNYQEMVQISFNKLNEIPNNLAAAEKLIITKMADPAYSMDTRTANLDPMSFDFDFDLAFSAEGATTPISDSQKQSIANELDEIKRYTDEYNKIVSYTKRFFVEIENIINKIYYDGKNKIWVVPDERMHTASKLNNKAKFAIIANVETRAKKTYTGNELGMLYKAWQNTQQPGPGAGTKTTNTEDTFTREADQSQAKKWHHNNAARWIEELVNRVKAFGSEDEISAYYKDEQYKPLCPIQMSNKRLYNDVIMMMQELFDFTLDFYSNRAFYLDDEDTIESIQDQIDDIEKQLNILRDVSNSQEDLNRGKLVHFDKISSKMLNDISYINVGNFNSVKELLIRFCQLTGQSLDANGTEYNEKSIGSIEDPDVLESIMTNEENRKKFRLVDDAVSSSNIQDKFDELQDKLNLLKRKKAVFDTLGMMTEGNAIKIDKSNWEDIVKHLSGMAKMLLVNRIDKRFDDYYDMISRRKVSQTPVPEPPEPAGP